MTNDLPRLYSPKEVWETFPEGHRPSLRRIITAAKHANCCCKLGKGIGFTADQVKAFHEYISCPLPSGPIQRARRGGSSLPPLPGSTYLKARELLTEAKRKASLANTKRKRVLPVSVDKS